ncbi:MAG: SMP-30/gluconolactonase/LRE family protein [Acidobacteriota bacterium]|nr:MAG: SMP-30/gluconolactonase/LRE family protein [Acidobacteriota bacterium]
MRNTRCARATAVATVAALLTAALVPCASAKSGSKNRVETGASTVELVWPLPPDQPRIRYLGTLTGESDYQKNESRFRRFLLGRRTEPGVSLHKPYGVTTDSAGRIYVSDTGLGTIVVFDETARQVNVLTDEGGVRLVTPIGMAIDRDDRLFVADADLNQVFCIGPDGQLLMSIGASEKLQNPTGVAIDQARGRLYVVDSHLHKLFIYDLAGRLLETWGSRGSIAGTFNFPTNIALDPSGNVYVVDTGNFRVQVFDPDGKLLIAFGEAGDGSGSFHRPKGIALDSDQNIYVVDAAFNNFQIFDREGQLLLFVG